MAAADTQDELDERYMIEALRLARREQGHTRPNPPVGAVVVTHGTVVGVGAHRKAGGPHAEVVALENAGRRAKGGTLYVTLEPCSTQGRTPPCTERIVASGIRKVVVGVRDPNPAHLGRGLRDLERRGICTSVGTCAEEARQLIAPFAKWIRSGRPYLTLKMAMTLDGRIADRQGTSRWITSEASRRYVQALRKTADAIIVGAGTAYADNPSLLCRTGGNRMRYRVIVDSKGTTPPSARVLTDGAADHTIIATTVECPSRRRLHYEKRGAQVWVLPTKGAWVSLRTLTRRLGRLGFLHLLCEGGGTLAGSLVKEQLVDDFRFFVAPRLLGNDSTPVIGVNGWTLASGPKLSFVDVTRLGDDILLSARPHDPKHSVTR